MWFRDWRSPTCNMQGMSTANRGWVYSLLLQGCCSHWPGAGSTCVVRDCRDDTVSHEGSTHQGDLRCNHSPHTQRSWSVSDGKHTVGGHHESSSYGTPESNAVWRLSHTAHTCRGGFLQQVETKEVFNLSMDSNLHSEWYKWLMFV